jgi:short-subunit dehydrogenase
MEKGIVLITGATAGIGRHTALHLARQGFHVIATGRKPAALAALLAEAKGLKLSTVELDVTNAESVERARVEVLRVTSGHGVDVLVNNAGFGALAPVVDTSDEDFRAMYETNVFGLMAVTRAFVKEMIARGSGRIVNVSSVGGRVTLPFFGAYNSTKYAVESISDALRRELRPAGIRVSLIEPGMINSNFADTSMSYVAKYKDPSSMYASVFENAEELRKVAERTAVGPEVVAKAIRHAAGARRPRARYVVPMSSRFFVWMLAFIPTSWVDFALGRLLSRGADRMRALPAPREALDAVQNT